MKTLAELRKMSEKELSDIFDLPENAASALKSGLKEKYFPILIDNSLTAKKRAEKLDLAKRTVENYRCALLRVGLAERKIPSISYEQDYELILNTVTYPMNLKKLEAKTNIGYRLLKREIRELEKQGKLSEFRLIACRSSSTACHSRELFGELMNVKYVYKRGQEKAVAQFIAKNLPLDKILESKPMRVSLTYRLKNCLAPQIFNHLYRLYHPQ